MAKRVIEAQELYYRRDGEKRSVILNSPREVAEWRSKLKRNKRKFLGVRAVELTVK